jgi:acetolactate synthase I/II/III large subunit
MAEITGGQAVHDALVKLGVTHVFGIPSVHNLPIFDAIRNGGKITPIITRHEQAAVHSADGYSRVSGRLGVAICSTGPGTTNTVTGLYEAGFASSRVLLITGQTESVDYGKGRAAGHEAEKQLPMLRTVARAVESPRYTQDLAPAVFRVAADIQTGRPQPGAIEMCIDLQYGKTSVPVGEPIRVEPVRPQGDTINRAVDMIGSASKRVILAGGGVVNGGASAELQQLAEALNAPVFVSGNGRGAIPDDHPLAMGQFINRRNVLDAMQDCDLVIAIGTRFRGPMRAWETLPGKLIHIDVDPQVHGLVVTPDVSVIADAKESVKALLASMNAKPGDASFVKGLAKARDDVEAQIRKTIGPDMEVIMDTIRSSLDRDAPFVRDMTMPAYAWGNQLFPILEARTTMNPNSGAIGPGLPLANGAALASGKKTVAIHGDGGVMVHIGELSTTAQYNLPVVLCIFTDGGYGVLRGIQSDRFEGRNVGVDLTTPNFALVARGMGVPGQQVKGIDEFKKALKHAMAVDGPYVLDIDLRTIAPMQGFGKRIEFVQPE